MRFFITFTILVLVLVFFQVNAEESHDRVTRQLKVGSSAGVGGRKPAVGIGSSGGRAGSSNRKGKGESAVSAVSAPAGNIGWDR